MAETFVALRREPAGVEQRVCLKRVLPSCSSDPSVVTHFQDEARLIARLQCSQIVQLYDFERIDDGYYMTLELVEGLDVAALLRALSQQDLTLSPPHALYVVSEILTALAYAHAQADDGVPLRIVHRNVSPSNVLLSSRGEVKLTDFGIAQARDRSHETQARPVEGKLAYMSPEQIRAEPLDGRSDLFSVGVVLFELLAGTHPFDDESDAATMWSIVSGQRKPLRQLRSGLPSAVYELVDALLATDRDRRPENAEAALRLLPTWWTPFVSQQELADLVRRCKAGRPDLVTSPAAVVRTRPLASVMGPQAAVLAADSTRRADEVDALGIQSASARAPVTAQASVAPRRARRAGLASSMLRWTVSALLILSAVIGARLWWARSGNAQLRSEPTALPSSKTGSREGAAAAAAGVVDAHSTPAQSLREVVSPPKSGAPAVVGASSDVVTPRKARERAAPGTLSEVVTSAKAEEPAPAALLRDTTSAEKSDRSTSRNVPLADVVSPPKSGMVRQPGAR